MYTSKRLFTLLLLTFCFSCGQQDQQSDVAEAPPEGGIPPEMVKMAALDQERGLRLKTENATPGYILFSSLTSSDVYLIDLDGKVVHEWKTNFGLGSHYLMEDGRLYVHSRDPEAVVFSGGGMAGRVQEFSWDGELLWEYKLANQDNLMHHDFAVMPNGNILLIVWESKTPEEAMAAGRMPHLIPKAGVWPDKIIEVKPTKPSGGEIVWEWYAWDHMIQDVNPDLPNYGKLSDHPERININNGDTIRQPDPEEFERGKAQGQYAANATIDNMGSDMFHTNAIDYNPELDQIVLSIPDFSEIWIIDHSTTTEEASGSTGGKSGKGGDLLYRWGNPQEYNRGDTTDQYLGFEHDVRWILPGYPGEGDLTIFNNNFKDADGETHSQVTQITPPMDADGKYIIPESGPIGPEKPTWTYTANNEGDYLAMFISSAHRMKNGHTLMNFGPQGRLQEITEDGEVVWDYWSPYIGQWKLPDGTPPQPVGPFMYAIFRATHIPVDHPAVAGKELQPIDPQPATQKPPM
ncbi:aryl-sulfate sulfotransferase [Fulvivirga sedimenti]|uniref:Aryl-sulfate sulfotransferase n=1 Tax=Fulvivirga sedimenti TaxID=2879465 RepID=A0A9X1HRM1_9BACT|nr:aryl-sulfate sulfotransferase [Fulvivirga sedimenti]MCA6075507.1 aryl-sulfate sulfotransferase [Fulvivirga sedimenti]MCA6076684.1 aryl-sulfate sulfotransferase [Fulvivirga sedimenti]MCA6077812.1 aryl-sulfate sulfotransferase [Fulvivirga sedimenti]